MCLEVLSAPFDGQAAVCYIISLLLSKLYAFISKLFQYITVILLFNAVPFDKYEFKINHRQTCLKILGLDWSVWFNNWLEAMYLSVTANAL